MAVWTMYRSGNKSVPSGTASSPWYGGSQIALNSKPGDGDTITLAGFDLNIDENTTVGSSTAGANAISGTGHFTIKASILLVCRGHLAAGADRTFAMEDGSILEFDASLTSAQFGLLLTYKTNFVCGVGCEIRSNAGGGIGYIDINASRKIDLLGLSLTRMGDLTRYGIKLISLTTDSADSRFLFKDCTLDTCGMRWLTVGMPDVYRCEIARIKEVNNVGTSGTAHGLGYAYPFSWFNVCPVTSGAGTRTFDNNVCQHATYFAVPSAWTSVQGNSFAGQVFTANTVKGFPLFKNNFNVHNSTVYGASGVPLLGNQTDCYHVADSSITDNWHAHNNQTAVDTTLLYDGLIFDSVGIVNTTDLGELINMPANPTVAVVVTIRRCLGLPSMANQDGDTSYRACCGALVWAGGANMTVNIEHCTHYSLFAKGVDGALLATGETFATRTGLSTSLQGNIAWSSKAGSAHLVRNRGFGGIDTNADVVTTAGHNLIFNGSPSYSTTPGVGYYYKVSSTTPGTGDLTSDPAFLDPYRNIATWAVSLGYSGTNAQLLAAAAAYIGADCSLIETRLAALMAHVRAGFAPLNAQLAGSAHDGGDMGAVAVILPMKRGHTMPGSSLFSLVA